MLLAFIGLLCFVTFHCKQVVFQSQIYSVSTSLALDGYSKSTQANGQFHLCPGMTLWDNSISTCCSSSNSCSDTFKMFSCWPANCHRLRWVFSNTVVCFLYLPFCFELWMWLHSGRKPSSQFQQAYDCSMSAVYLLSLINHTHAFLQPLLVCVWRSNLCEHAWLAKIHLEEYPRFFVFTYLSQPLESLFSLAKLMVFSGVGNMCWGCFNECRN